LARGIIPQLKIEPQSDKPPKIAELTRSLCHSWATCYNLPFILTDCVNNRWNEH